MDESLTVMMLKKNGAEEIEDCGECLTFKLFDLDYEIDSDVAAERIQDCEGIISNSTRISACCGEVVTEQGFCTNCRDYA